MEVTGFWSGIVTGIVLGAIGRLLIKGRQPIGWIWTILAGVGGALVGGWAAGELGWDGFSLFLLQAVAAALLVAFVAKVTS